MKIESQERPTVTVVEQRLKRYLSVLLVTVMILSSFSIISPGVSAASAYFSPPHKDAGVDINDNKLYDFLEVYVSVQVDEAGWYGVRGDLLDPGKNQIDVNFANGYYDVGLNIITLRYSGILINTHGVDGPYIVHLTLLDENYTIIGIDEHYTEAYHYSDFEPVGAKFYPPHDDYGIDTNANGYFDWLVVDVNLNVTTAGWYYVWGSLRDKPGNYIWENFSYLYLSEGIQTVQLAFLGLSIYLHGYDGTYIVELLLYDDYDNLLDTGLHSTNYSHTVFEPPGAQFQPPYSEYVEDTNANGYYDWLVVDVNINVTTPGWYEIWGDLLDRFGWYIDRRSNSAYLDAGIQTVTLRFSGCKINHQGFDGPYYLHLYLLDQWSNTLDTDVYTTADYWYFDFEPLAQFYPPHDDYGVDTNGNGYYDYLVVEASVYVATAGWYTISGELRSPSFELIAENLTTVYLSAGLQLQEFRYNGTDIYKFGVDGPYRVLLNLWDESLTYLGYDIHTTAGYAYSEFEHLGAYFSPPHSDYGEDTNANDLYDWLTVDVNVTVLITGTYEIDAALWDKNSNLMDWTYKTEYLDVGIHTVTLRFYGRNIYNHMVDGPYRIELTMYDESSNYLDDDTLLTDAYTYTQFEHSDAKFSSPHTENPLDINGNGLYDWLIINVLVDVGVSGWYILDGGLFDKSGMLITAAYNRSYLAAGLQTVALAFLGSMIYDSGLDGPYNVDLQLYDDYMTPLDIDNYATADYSYSQFEHSGAFFSPPHSDYGEDTNGNGLYDYLAVNVTVNVTAQGVYYIYGYLYDQYSKRITEASNYTYLDIGLSEVVLRFSGGAIFINAEYGPYTVELYLYDYYWNLLDVDEYTTSDYSPMDFEGQSAFYPPHLDYLLDTDGNGKAEWLMLEATILIGVSGWYHVEGYLYDGTYLIDSDENYTYLEFGYRNVLLMFSGPAIYAHGVDGPYDVLLILRDVSSSWLDDDWHMTTGYSFSQFEASISNTPPNAEFTVYPMIGSISTTFLFDPSMSNDTEDQYASLEGRWDWEGDGTWDTAWAPLGNVTHSFLSDGTYSVILQVRDTGGLTDVVAHSVIVDSVPPTTVASLSGNEGLNGWYISGVSITLTATDTGESGVAYSMYRVDGGAWQYYLFMPISVTTDGIHTVEFYSVDFANNMENIRIVNFKIDMTPPTTTHGILGYTVTLSASDNIEGSGVNYTRYRIDGSFWQLYTGPFSAGSSGVHTVEYYSVDLAGNAETTKSTTVGLADTTAPETSISLAGTAGLNGWYVSDVTVTLTATDSQSGVNYTRYRIDGGSWQTYSSQFLISAEGNHTLEFYSVDYAGNNESTHSITVKVDKTPPTTSATGYGYNVTLTASDSAGGSGVDRIMYRIDSGSWQIYTGPFSAGTSGSHNVTFYAVDKAGNIETTKWIMTPIADTTKPSTTIDLDGTMGNNGWYVSSVTVTLSATDIGSGLNYTEYRIDGGSWTRYTTPFIISANGIHTVEYRSVDVAGNAEDAKSAQVKIDTVAPSLSISHANGTTFPADNVIIEWNVSDETSGVENIFISVDGGTFRSVGNVMNVTLDDLQEGNHTIIVRVVDRAGLTTEKTLNFKVSKGEAGAGALDFAMIGIIAAVIVACIVVAIFLLKKKKGPTISPPSPPSEEELPPPPSE